MLNVSIKTVREQRTDPSFPVYVCDGVFGENICYDKTVLSVRYLQDILEKKNKAINRYACNSSVLRT